MITGKDVLDRESSRCKGPKMRALWLCSRRAVGLVWFWWTEDGKVVGEEL